MTATDFAAEHARWANALARVQSLRTIFAVGCAKSGTTWLEHILNAHPEVILRGEGRFFWQLDPILQKAVAAFNQALPGDHTNIAKVDDADYRIILRSIIDQRLAKYLLASEDKPGLAMIGDKTPMHTLAVGKLNTLYPHASFVHIIRDPRDATISQWFFWAEQNDPRNLEEFVRYSITKVWPLNVVSARNAGAPLHGRYHEMRYEDLHHQPIETARALLEFLEVEASDETVERCMGGASFESKTGGRRPGSEERRSFFRKGTVGDWRNHLPDDLVRDCCEAIRPLMESFGYSPDPEAPIAPLPHFADAPAFNISVG
jgi:hypothetical protein